MLQYTLSKAFILISTLSLVSSSRHSHSRHWRRSPSRPRQGGFLDPLFNIPFNTKTASLIPEPSIYAQPYLTLGDQFGGNGLSTTSTGTAPTTCATSNTTAPKSTTVVNGPGKGRISDSFVKRDGYKLILDKEPFRMLGGNVYWMGLDENVVPDPSYPSKSRVLEIMADFESMGATTIRAHTLGVSTGNSLSVEPDLNVFNDEAYEAIDWAVYAAYEYGLKLMIPLTDNYQYYHGGKFDFIGWQGYNKSDPTSGGLFYNDTTIIKSFKTYISHHLNHINQFTGRPLKDEPSILGWETGNELSLYTFITNDGPPPPSWTKEIASYIKSIDFNHLVIDGTYGIFDNGMLEIDEVDIVTDHFYPLSISRLAKGMAKAKRAGKNYLVGEYDWTNGTFGGDQLDAFLDVIEISDFAGDLFWSLFGHTLDGSSSQCTCLVTHDDGYAIYYPGANNQMQASMLAITKHYSYTTGKSKVPATLANLPAVQCPQPMLPTPVASHQGNPSASLKVSATL